MKAESTRLYDSPCSEARRRNSIELYGNSLPFGNSPSAIKCLRSGSRPDDFDRGIERFDQYR